MDEESARVSLAREYLSKQIGLKFHASPPPGAVFYGYDPDENYLFSFGLGGLLHVGGEEFIAVS